MFPRGRCVFSGHHWRTVMHTTQVVDHVRDIAFDDIDDVIASLGAEEVVVFVRGYDDAASFAFVGRCVDVDLDKLPVPAARLPRLSTTETQHQRHLDRVRRCRELLLDGVLYQANLAHKLDVDTRSHEEGLSFFLAARARDLGCSAFIDRPASADSGAGASLVSLSPERFLVGDLPAGRVSTFPIKGTVPASADPATLTSSTKDQAEHVMIVDLLRNDLGRVASVGSVVVESLMHVVTTPSVHHLESRISARLRDDVGLLELLKATTPGGSITGAPKSAAVDVIRDLEDGDRGVYTGVLGVVDGNGVFVSSLLIRTWVRNDDGPGSVHVGGGIVIDSDPEREWQETLTKARAFGAVVVVD